MSIQAFSVNIPEISILYLGIENECKFKLFQSILQKLANHKLGQTMNVNSSFFCPYPRNLLTLFWDRCRILIQAVPVHITEISFLYTGTANECKFKLFLSISQKLTYYILGQTLHFSSSFFCQYPRN
jgi:hypothetical protein